MNKGDAGLHMVLRLATGVTFAFVLCEAAGWAPSFLCAVFTAVFLVSLPGRPTPKMALSLVIVMASSSLFVYAISALLYDAPVPLVVLLSFIVFLSFRLMAAGRAKLPGLLLLICVSTVPVIATIAPAQALALPLALNRSMLLAMLIIQIVYSLWPETLPPAPAPAAPVSTISPGVLAALGTAIVVPLMIVYLLYGLTDALPVLIATVMLVANFDPQRGRAHALGLVAGNVGGGFLGVLAHLALLTTPTLTVLALLLFLVLLALGKRIAAGGPGAAITLVACNSMLIILGTSIATGPASLSLWLTRMSQFVAASIFAVGMMNVIWYRNAPVSPTSPRETTS